MFGSPVRSVEIFCTRKLGDDTIVTRVGSSSPETVGLAVPLTFGSSLNGEDRAARQANRRLIGDDRAVGERRPQRDVELDQDLAVDRQVQVTDVDDAGALGAARAAGGADVGAGRVSDERQRARPRMPVAR